MARDRAARLPAADAPRPSAAARQRVRDDSVAEVVGCTGSLAGSAADAQRSPTIPKAPPAACSAGTACTAS